MFIRISERSIPRSDFRWTTEAEQAFQQLKKHLSALPMLAAPKPHEELIMYLSATHGAFSAVLLTEWGTIQTPVYFISLFDKPSTAELILNCLVSGFKTFSISQVPRSKNKKADALSKIASTSFAHLSKQVLVEVLETKSIAGKEVTAVIEEEGPTWMTELVKYLKEGTLPADEKEARKIRLKSRQYEVMKGILYKLSFLTPWLRDAQDMIRKCSDCQIHRPVTRHPQQPLTPITAPWPFYKWGINIACPFPEGPRKVKFLIVAMDYFTKWIEAKAVATIIGEQVKKFVWDNIIRRFGIPREIILDNGKQFANNPFKDWCDKLNITQHFASVKYPQSNGLVERANRSLGEGIKARLGEGNKNWVEELPH
nr:reverse transcriptase domain-containing protein [Tanacetum cinerariifolium]